MAGPPKYESGVRPTPKASMNSLSDAGDLVPQSGDGSDGTQTAAQVDELAALRTAVARLEAEAQEHRLRAELLNRAVGVPEPGAGAWAQLRLTVTGQVSAKLARFGPNRGFLVASLVLLCNFIFICVFTSSKLNSCTQTSAIMDTEPAVADTYTTMFLGGSFGGKFICSSSVDAVQEYTPGDTCTVHPSDWLAKNGVCEVDTGRCAPGTDCTDCPTDPFCEPGRDGMPIETSETCACAQDDFCCQSWDVSCSLCELGYDTTPTGIFVSGDDLPTEWARDELMNTVPAPSLRESLFHHHFHLRLDTLGMCEGCSVLQGSFRDVRAGSCAASSCPSDAAAQARVERLSRNALDDAILRLSVLGETHLATTFSNAGYVAEAPSADNLGDWLNERYDLTTGLSGVPAGLQSGGYSLGYQYNRDDVRGLMMEKILPWPATVYNDPKPQLSEPLVQEVDQDWSGERLFSQEFYEQSDQYDRSAPRFFIDSTSGTMVGHWLLSTGERFPGCGFSKGARDMLEARDYVAKQVGLEMSVRSADMSECTALDSRIREAGESAPSDLDPETWAQWLDYDDLVSFFQFGGVVGVTEDGEDLLSPPEPVMPPPFMNNICTNKSPTTCDNSCQQRHCTGWDFDGLSSYSYGTPLCELLPGCTPGAASCTDSSGTATSHTTESACLSASTTRAGNSWTAARPGVCTDSSGSTIDMHTTESTCTSGRYWIGGHPGGCTGSGATMSACESGGFIWTVGIPGACWDSSGTATSHTTESACTSATTGFSWTAARPGVCTDPSGSTIDMHTTESTCTSATTGYTWNEAAPCEVLDDVTPAGGIAGKFWQVGPVDAKLDQCTAFHRLQYDSCYDPGTTRADGSAASEPGPLYRDGICQVDSGQCSPGTDCTDCPSDAACPGVDRQRFTPCRLPGLECDRYVVQQFGADHDLVKQCGISTDMETCGEVDCGQASAEKVVASVLYITCPDLSVELGAAMGYLFVIQGSATAFIVIALVLASGESFKSAWDQARSVLRADMATEAAEGQMLLEEAKAATDDHP